MRINQFVALSTGLSRRQADALIREGRLKLNGQVAQLGAVVEAVDELMLDGQKLFLPNQTTTVLLHKPVGYVSSRAAQGSPTIYDLLPESYRRLKPVGRLDKDSSGLLLLSDDGQLANRLTHPRYHKTKLYQLKLNKPLLAKDIQRLNGGVMLTDGPSRLTVTNPPSAQNLQVSLSEGRNRQIRRTFRTLGYEVKELRRLAFGPYKLGRLKAGQFKEVDASQAKINAST